MLGNLNEKNNILRPALLILFAFIAGCIFTAYIIHRERFTSIGILDSRYNRQHARATEIIGRLEEELGRERELNKQLREYNNRAREITGELTGTAERNVRNLQDAITIISEIRQKIKVLADFFDSSNPGDSNR